MTPAWTISADGTDLTTALAARLLSLRLTDASGLDADLLELTVADPRGMLEMPKLNARLEVSLGYQGGGLVRMGTFVVDGLELANAPRVLTISAHGADLTATLRDRRTDSFEATTVGAVVQEIAARQGLTPAVSPGLGTRALARVDQTNESDISFLTRIGQWFDALVSVKDARLIFAARGQGQSASGQALGVLALAEMEVLSWRWQHSTEDLPTTVEARVYDPATATDTRVSAQAQEGTGSRVRLRSSFTDPDLAQTAATSYATAAARNSRSLSLLLPGRPTLAAEAPLACSGFHPAIDGRWIVTKATHRIDAGGYVTEADAVPEIAPAKTGPRSVIGV